MKWPVNHAKMRHPWFPMQANLLWFQVSFRKCSVSNERATHSDYIVIGAVIHAQLQQQGGSIYWMKHNQIYFSSLWRRSNHLSLCLKLNIKNVHWCPPCNTRIPISHTNMILSYLSKCCCFKHTSTKSGKVRLMFIKWNSHYGYFCRLLNSWETMSAEISSLITQSSWACMQISPSQFILKPTSISASASVSLPPPLLPLLCQQQSCTLVVPKKFLPGLIV